MALLKNKLLRLAAPAAALFWMGLPGCAPRTAAPIYEVRGVVIEVQAAEGGGGSLTLLHEAIPGFKDRQGKVTGMSVMTMSFAAEPQVSLKNLQPKDKIVFRLEVRWELQPPLRITEIQRLDPALELALDGYSLE